MDTLKEEVSYKTHELKDLKNKLVNEKEFHQNIVKNMQSQIEELAKKYRDSDKHVDVLSKEVEREKEISEKLEKEMVNLNLQLRLKQE
jgi:ssRNA-specific RNase YbeY (16S rRNA maturation enzyme)